MAQGWGEKEKRTYDVEREIVVPREAVEPDAPLAAAPAAFALGSRDALEAAVAELVPLFE